MAIIIYIIITKICLPGSAAVRVGNRSTSASRATNRDLALFLTSVFHEKVMHI